MTTAVRIVYLGIPVLTVAIQLGLAWLVRTRHADVRGSEWFVATLLLGSLWMGFHVWMLLVDGGIQWVAYVLATKTAVVTYLAWVVFASQYSRVDFHRHPLAKVGFAITGVTLVLPTFLEPVRELFYERPRYVTEPLSYVAADSTVLYFALSMVVLALVAAGLYSLVGYLLGTSRRAGTQLVLLVLGTLAVAVTALLGEGGVFPARALDHTAYGALPFSICMALALFRFRLFDVKPVARNALVEDLKDPVFVLDSAGRLGDYNEAATHLHPDLEAMLDRPLAEIDEGLAAAAGFPDRLDVSAGAASERPDRVTLSIEGEPRHYSVDVSRIGTGGAGFAEWYSVLLRDVTDLERSRWQLARQNERLDQVASTISHDLRNPLNVADGHAEILDRLLTQADLRSEREADAEESLETIRRSHRRMGDIVDDVLTIAREGKTVEETESVSLEAVVKEAWVTVGTGPASLSVPADGTVEADRTRLVTVLENLFRNAVQHGSTSPASQAQQDAGRASSSEPSVADAPEDAVEHSSTSPPSQAREDAGEHGPADVTVTVEPTADGFAVADDGPGIDEHERKRIFDDGYTTEPENTGLGLSIVRTMAESHGWTVSLDEAYSEGARFVFRTTGDPAVETDGTTPSGGWPE